MAFREVKSDVPICFLSLFLNSDVYFLKNLFLKLFLVKVKSEFVMEIKKFCYQNLCQKRSKLNYFLKYAEMFEH